MYPVRAGLVSCSGPFSPLDSLSRREFSSMAAGGKTIIFVDEIDALAPSREKGGVGGSELHNRIVATFLTLLDGVKPSAKELGNLWLSLRTPFLVPARSLCAAASAANALPVSWSLHLVAQEPRRRRPTRSAKPKAHRSVLKAGSLLLQPQTALTRWMKLCDVPAVSIVRSKSVFQVWVCFLSRFQCVSRVLGFTCCS